MKTKKKDALVTFKVCPRCGGTGQIPCDGKEFYRQQAKLWAEQFHLQPVLVERCVGYDEHNKRLSKSLPGLAVRSINPGGWGAVKVYVAVTEQPKSIYATGLEQTVRALLRFTRNADYINNKALWYMHVSWGYRDDIHLLDHWPEMIQEILRLTEGGAKLLEIQQ